MTVRLDGQAFEGTVEEVALTGVLLVESVGIACKKALKFTCHKFAPISKILLLGQNFVMRDCPFLERETV